MDIGLLWYDARPIPPGDRVKAAADRYCTKYGTRPDRCYAPAAEIEQALDVELGPGASVRVTAAPNILAKHLWIGKEDQ